MAPFKPDPESTPCPPPQSDLARIPDKAGLPPDGGERPPKFASFKQRLLAFLLDGLILYGFLFLFFIIALYLIMFFAPKNMDTIIINIYLACQIMTIPTLYYALQESSAYQATFGKRIVGIRVATLDGRQIGFGRALARFLFKIPSALPLMGGFLMQPFSEKKQALHDILAKTLVIDSRS